MDLKQVDLNLLVALDALLKERSVTQAGRRIGLTQPAMSAALARLRDLLGDPLLERAGRGYQLTAFSRDAAARVDEILRLIEHTLGNNRDFDPATVRRRFRIATSDYAMCLLLPRVVQRLRKLAPGIRLHLESIDSRLHDEVTKRSIDLSIHPRREFAGVNSHALFDDDFVCAVWNGNSVVGAALTTDQFYSLPQVSFAQGANTLVDYLLTAPGRPFDVPVTSTSFISLPFLLHNTDLIAVVQRLLGERLRETADIRLVELPVPSPKTTTSMWWSSTINDPAHEWLRAQVIEVAAGIGAPGRAMGRYSPPLVSD